MFFGIDLNQALTFPFKGAEARKYFLIGCGVALAGFIIPVVPYLALLGYAARIAKQIFNSESPRHDRMGRLGRHAQRWRENVRRAHDLRASDLDPGYSTCACRNSPADRHG